jgi:hypothetical protein
MMDHGTVIMPGISGSLEEKILSSDRIAVDN